MVKKLSSVYVLNLVLGGSYDHEFKTINIIKIRKFDGEPIRIGFHGVATGSLYHHQDENILILTLNESKEFTSHTLFK